MMNKFIMSILALVAGCLLPLGFAPFHAFPIAFISPAVLLYCWRKATPRQALWYGFLFGIGMFGVGTSWIYISVHQFGNANAFLAGFITVLFILFYALFPATQGYVFAHLRKRANSQLMINLMLFPATWVLWEGLRTLGTSGFPWLFLGYSQLDYVLRGFAPLFGVFGISFLVTFISGAIVVLFTQQSKKTKLIIAASIVVIFLIGAPLTAVQWTKPAGKPILTSQIQGNIPQSLKWNREALLHILSTYQQETYKNWQSKLIVWPEAAIPITLNDVKFFVEMLDQKAKQHNTSLIIGVPIANTKKNTYYNALISIGDGHGVYFKRRLVPLGEYVPLNFLFAPLMSYLNVPMSDITPGPDQQPPLTASNIAIAPFICYEIAFPNEVLNSTKGKQVIISISDDSWFGDSFALEQQLQFGQMRSLETGRFMLYSTNTGITAIINPLGKVQAIAPKDKLYVLTGKITPMMGNTPLMIWGYWPLFIIMMLLVILTQFKFKRTN